MRALIALSLCLAACGDDSNDIRIDRAQPSEWAIGAPDAHPSGPSFDIPQTGSINYITRATGSLAGKHSITLRYKVEMADDTRIFPPSMPDGPSIITLYFQRKGDDWSGAGKYAFYRWYATISSQMPITAGEHEITAAFTDRWTAIEAGSSNELSQAFPDALKDAGRVGFVLGGGTGYGHGVSASGPVRFTITSFTIA